MSDAYQNDIFNSDLDTFKQSGVQIGSVTFSGSIGAGAEIDLFTSSIALDSLDFAQVLFDNSYYHPSQYRDLSFENATMINETTNGSQLQVNVFEQINGNTIRFGATMFNPYSVAVNLSTTTIHFIYVPFQATI